MRLCAFDRGLLGVLAEPAGRTDTEFMRRSRMKDEKRPLKQPIADLASLQRELKLKMQTFDEEVERRVAERTYKLEKMCEELKRLDKAKDGFLSAVTHELRTPLTSIRSFAEILVEYPDEPVETRKQFYLIMKQESERLSRLIDNVLDLSKIRAGKTEWYLKKLHSASVIQEAIDAVSCLMLKKDHRLDIQIDEKLPAFRADEDRIVQVLTNLIGNAIKFTPKGGEIRIAAKLLEGKRSEDRRDFIHISVSDTGIGISEEDLSRVFDDYSQCQDTLTEKSKGTGLGLPICKEIVSRHRGNIWVESEKGMGSTFNITLPVELPEIDGSTSETEEPSLSDQEGRCKEHLH
jgi:signal transduction histidine kinase